MIDDLFWKKKINWIQQKLFLCTYPISTSTKTTALNVTIQVNDSMILSWWKRFNAAACVYIPFKATIIMPDKTHCNGRFMLCVVYQEIKNTKLKLEQEMIIVFFLIWIGFFPKMINLIFWLFTLGNTSKNGAIHRRIIKIRIDDTTEAIWVRPPVCSWSNDRDNDVPFGTHENAPPTIFDKPCTIAANGKSTIYEMKTRSSRPKWSKYHYHCQQLLIRSNLVVLFLCKNQRHRNGNGVANDCDGNWVDSDQPK